jgi:small subunit ribosomal protein S4
MSEAFNSPGITGVNLLRSLERRLDNVTFLLGFADSRKQARQLVRHGHLLVNGVKNDIPSYQVSARDVITWKERVKGTDFFKERTEDIPKRPIPSWLSLEQADMKGTVNSLPADEDLQQSINSRLIVEFYSR